MKNKPFLHLDKFSILFLMLLVISNAAFCLPLDIDTIRIHYCRDDNNYEDLGLWCWGDFATPSANWYTGALPFNNCDSLGRFVDLKLKQNAKNIGFLVVNRKSGEKDAGNKEIKLDSSVDHLYIRKNDDKVYLSPDFEVDYEIVKAFIEDVGIVRLSFNDKPNMSDDRLKELIKLEDACKNEVEITGLSHEQGCKYLLKANFNPDNTPLLLTFMDRTTLALKSWRFIDKMYAYSGDDLGCSYADGKYSLKLWAPRASKVRVLIFDKNDQSKCLAQKDLLKGNSAIWQVSLDSAELPVSDLSGYYYQYEVTNHGELPKIALDPYAKSMAPVTMSPTGADAGSSNDSVGKAAFVNAKMVGKTPVQPKISNFSKREDAIIYEIHLRDFTSDPSIENQLKNRWGSFRAFVEKLDYIKSLGVTHVQLLPVMAWYFGDETRMNKRESHYSAKNNQYNWGYDPHSYFSPDGAYSLNPEVAEERIAELKFLIDEIHKAGMGVILDVVYTHMAQARFLNDIVPDYYFFQRPEGGFLGDFGNNLATNRKMAEKLMLDSVKYWFSEYKIDGMRWDMMGDATCQAVQNAFDAAKKINPLCVFIGEGWRTFKGHIDDPALAGMGADQDWMSKTNDVGVFSDEFRNELKSGYGCEGEPRFLTGGRRNIYKLFNNIKGQPDNTPADSPGDMVQYIAAHDNMPLYDVIAQSIKKDPAIAENDLEIHQRVRVGNALILTSQGTAFIHAGQEFGRTKQWLADGKPEDKFHELVDEGGRPFEHPYFIHDSYDSSDAINMFDWSKATNAEKFPNNVATVNYTRGLIALRRSSDAFRLGSQRLVNENVHLINVPEINTEDLLLAFSCKSTTSDVFMVFINADNTCRELTLREDLSKADLLVDRISAGTKKISSPQGVILDGSRLVLDPLTVAVFRLSARKQ